MYLVGILPLLKAADTRLQVTALATFKQRDGVRQRMEPSPQLLLRTVIAIGWSKLY